MSDHADPRMTFADALQEHDERVIAILDALVAERDEAVEMSRQMVAAYELAGEETEAAEVELAEALRKIGRDSLTTAPALRKKLAAAEAEAEVQKRLYEASVKDRVRLREALVEIQGCIEDHRLGRTSWSEHRDEIDRIAGDALAAPDTEEGT